jgi:hypothetical protein
MSQQVSVAARSRRWTFGTIPFWLAQAPIFVAGFAMAGLAVRGEWIGLVVLVTCGWVYARVLRQPYVATRLERLVSRASRAIESRYSKPPAPVEVTVVPPDPEDELPAQLADVPPAQLVEPVRPRRAPARVASSARTSPTKRLLQLEELRETGLVSAAEYHDKRQEILRAI